MARDPLQLAHPEATDLFDLFNEHGLEYLIGSKRGTGCAKDEQDILELERIRALGLA